MCCNRWAKCMYFGGKFVLQASRKTILGLIFQLGFIFRDVWYICTPELQLVPASKMTLLLSLKIAGTGIPQVGFCFKFHSHVWVFHSPLFQSSCAPGKHPPRVSCALLAQRCFDGEKTRKPAYLTSSAMLLSYWPVTTLTESQLWTVEAESLWLWLSVQGQSGPGHWAIRGDRGAGLWLCGRGLAWVPSQHYEKAARGGGGVMNRVLFKDKQFSLSFWERKLNLHSQSTALAFTDLSGVTIWGLMVFC